ncbi:MAG TPA: hypothetical protein VM578_13175 [Candidatus Saccharimonadales bacterium]|nr:hypothetical protein [Candidatus Saccharimonadales bacterium]
MMTNFHDCTDAPHSGRRRVSSIAAHMGMAILFGAALVLGFAYAVMLLWNGVMPALLGVGHITFWRSAGLLLLARILVGGFHHGAHGHRRLGHGSSRRQYEEWWREIGQQSFRDFSTTHSPSPTDRG